ncbi:MAG TPA: rhomboid family intramembrane serine protease [Gemmatimonadaceae bacterium]|nr:rhomboid family intramembrane serine protease [Gemmatimonadaceae bacterium]
MFSFLTPWVIRLLVVTTGVSLLCFNVPALAIQLAFIPSVPYLVTHPWLFVTYMFVHGGWWHLIFNMITLAFFGPRVEAQLGGRRFLTLYFVSGIGGAVLSLLMTLFGMAGGAIIGASGAIFGVELVFAMFWPREKIFIWGVLPLEARWLVIGQTAYSMFAGFGSFSPGVAHFAHLGGYAAAFLYLRLIEFRSPLRQYQRKLETATFGKKAGPRLSDAAELARWEAIPREGLHAINLEELDRVLTKARRDGVRSLTADERAFLHRMSLRTAPSDSVGKRE